MNGSEQVDLKVVQVLVWPTDKALIASLSLEEKICWFAGQEPRYMLYLGNDKEFKAFWKLNYMYPLKAKRLLYKIKGMILNALRYKLFTRSTKA